jgi:hypothetical protein
LHLSARARQGCVKNLALADEFGGELGGPAVFAC